MDKNEPWDIMRGFFTGIANGIVGGFRDIAKMMAFQMGEDIESKPGSTKNPEVETPYPAPSTPTMKWKKNEIKKWMDVHGVAYNAGDTKKDLLQKISWS